MKFLSSCVLSSVLLAAVSADMLQINNPTDGTDWKTGLSNFVGWTGNCASMGNDSKSVKVDLVNGPPTAVRYVATLGTLDCSGSNTRADMIVPSTVASGQYAIVVRTSPQQSYTNTFQIVNPSQPGQTPAGTPGTTVPGSGSGSGSGTEASPTGSDASTVSTPQSLAILTLAGLTALGFQLI
ncbi:hypothetical protein BGW38_006381 [Lunasporangiospora selenospora]|uniref:Uncharacterized protein n=1 Tax=Lunasporangiospora selenospora TaxID=979761 RepID=A0A9P6FZ51_9FUNG|nr:hypothetical protein BGW38_006381 [Lunasporangiospora selenospora]